MSKQKREEEQKVLAQMNEAMQENQAQPVKKEENAQKTKKTSFYGATQPTTMHCRRCRSMMEDGVCPTCGFKMYVPMSEEKRKKIKTITTAIGFVVFIIIFLAIQFSKS